MKIFGPGYIGNMGSYLNWKVTGDNCDKPVVSPRAEENGITYKKRYLMATSRSQSLAVALFPSSLNSVA